MDRGAYWAAVHGVAKSRIWLSTHTQIIPDDSKLQPKLRTTVRSFQSCALWASMNWTELDSSPGEVIPEWGLALKASVTDRQEGRRWGYSNSHCWNSGWVINYAHGGFSPEPVLGWCLLHRALRCWIKGLRPPPNLPPFPSLCAHWSVKKSSRLLLAGCAKILAWTYWIIKYVDVTSISDRSVCFTLRQCLEERHVFFTVVV